MRIVFLSVPEGQNEGYRGIHPQVAPGARGQNIITKRLLWKGGTKRNGKKLKKPKSNRGSLAFYSQIRDLKKRGLKKLDNTFQK
jgi:hypothetical protein